MDEYINRQCHDTASLTARHNLTDRHRRELKQTTLLTREYCTPLLITLFGRYAATTTRSATGGYELLVVVDEITSPTMREDLQEFIWLRYPTTERAEQELFIHLFDRDFLLSHAGTSPFFKSILNEGIELYNNGTLPLDKLPLNKPLRKRRLDAIDAHAERCLDNAGILLTDAKAKLITYDCRVCGFYLYHALEQSLMALEYRYYGFVRHYTHISLRFNAARHASKELCYFYEMNKAPLLKMFRSLKKLHDNGLYAEYYDYPYQAVSKYAYMIGEMVNITSQAR